MILESCATNQSIFRKLAPKVDLTILAKNDFLENMALGMLRQVLNRELFLSIEKREKYSNLAESTT